MPHCSALKVEAAHVSKILVNFMGLHDVTHQEKGFFFSVITICEAGTLYSYDAHL
jgi:hypothetical protein